MSATLDATVPASLKAAELLRFAEEVFADRPTWIGFYRQILGPQGAVLQLFPGHDEWREARGTPEYRQVMAMFDGLDSGKIGRARNMITVRLPPELHDQVKRAAAQRQLSLNRFCLDTLFDAAHRPF